MTFEANQLGWCSVHEAVRCKSVISGVIAAKKQRDTAKEQNQRTKEQNYDNMILQLAARGAPLSGSNVPAGLKGSVSAILPYYFGDTERQMGADASSLYDAIRRYQGSPDLQIADYEKLLDTYSGTNEANRGLVRDISSGRMLEQELGEAQPVYGARRGVAEARRTAGLEALKETLNEIDAIQAGKGYSGDSTGKRMLRFNARRMIGSQAATDLAGAELENVMDERSIRAADRARRINSIPLADEMARADISRKDLVSKGVANNFLTAFEPFKPFNIGPHSFTPGEKLDALPSTLGNVANQMGQVNAQVGAGLVNYFQNKNLRQQAANQYKYGGYGTYAGGYGSSVGSGSFGAGSGWSDWVPEG